MEENQNLNGGQENVVDSPTTEEKANTTVIGEKEVEPATQPQGREENAKIAQYRREAEREAERVKKADIAIAKAYPQPVQVGDRTFSIKTMDDYAEAQDYQEQFNKRQHDADKLQASPELMKKLEEMEGKLSKYEKQQETEEYNKYISKLDADVITVMAQAKKDGAKINEVELLTAANEEGIIDLNKVYKLRFKPQLDEKTIKENAIKEYIEGLRQGKTPIEGKGESAVVVKDSPKTFKEAREASLAFLRSMKENK